MWFSISNKHVGVDMWYRTKLVSGILKIASVIIHTFNYHSLIYLIVINNLWTRRLNK